MLQNLTIKNIVLIESLQIPFEAGLCVLTGETGAGKSILLDALGLAMGKRAEARLVRHGEDKGSVVAGFDISDRKDIEALLIEHDIEPEDQLLLKRTITKEGKSKAFVNDEPVSVNFLQKLAEQLIEIHGQHDQRGLMDASTHRIVLDSYAGAGKQVTTVRANYHAWQTAAKELQSLKDAADKAREEEEYLRHVLDELIKLAPQEGEEDELASARTALMSSEKIMATLNDCLGQLTGKHNVQSALSSAERVLHRSSVPDAEIFEPALQALDRAGVEVAEAITAIEATARDLDMDPTSLEDTEERLFALRAAARKYNVPVDGLSEYADEVAAQIHLIESQDQQLGALEAQTAELRTSFIGNAEKLSELRKKFATKISTHIGKELTPLKMENAALQAGVEPLAEPDWNEYGQDRVRFLVRTNPGSPFGAMGKIASGGELSRFMLALKVVLSGVNSVPTMIFDEIDTGIGGATADAVGKRLGKLGEACQVLCVTHQPQVASYGAHHLKIQKTSKANSTTTHVRVLGSDDRTEEIARMLAGENITGEARAAAEKLMGSV
jgi:DNA repair protein RecN (Recombination protein N)